MKYIREKEKLQAMIDFDLKQMEIADKKSDEAFEFIRDHEDLPENHSAYSIISKYSPMHDYYQGRISALKEVVHMIATDDS